MICFVACFDSEERGQVDSATENERHVQEAPEARYCGVKNLPKQGATTQIRFSSHEKTTDPNVPVAGDYLPADSCLRERKKSS
jgi:hypothetical protein